MKSQPRKSEKPKASKAPLEWSFSAGGFIFRKAGRSFEILLIKDHTGRWAIPKGIIENGERSEVAALREAGEETGLNDLEVRAKLPKNGYFFRADGKLIRKIVSLYLIEATGGTAIEPAMLDPEEGLIADAAWYGLDEVRDRVDYKDLKEPLDAAIDYLNGQNTQ